MAASVKGFSMQDASKTPARKTRTGRTAPLGLRIRPDVKEAMEAAARDAGISATAWVEQTIRNRLVAEGYLPERPKSGAGALA
jgi:predicted HicB family RNase H-like nuclease